MRSTIYLAIAIITVFFVILTDARTLRKRNEVLADVQGLVTRGLTVTTGGKLQRKKKRGDPINDLLRNILPQQVGQSPADAVQGFTPAPAPATAPAPLGGVDLSKVTAGLTGGASGAGLLGLGGAQQATPAAPILGGLFPQPRK